MARKILLADDSVTAQNMGRKILADAGYEVIAVNNGSAALKKIAEAKPDLVILDVYMPGYSGLEVCQRMKESPETARIPVLLTVGKLEPFKPEEAQRVRAEGYIIKPFEASELLSALSKLEDKVVPRAEPSRPGRFARAIAAVEDSGFGGRGRPGEDNGWKNRIGFPHEKTEAEQKSAQSHSGDQSDGYNPVNRDLRTVVETPAELAEEKLAQTKQEEAQQALKHEQEEDRRQEVKLEEVRREKAAREEHDKHSSESSTETSVDVSALAASASSSALPTDVTEEELAAITAAAAQMQMASAGIEEEPRASDQRSQATGHASAPAAEADAGHPQSEETNRDPQIPACLWFFSNNKGPQGEKALRDRRGEILFIDARTMGTMLDRTARILTENDIAKIAGAYHAWRGTMSARQAGLKYEDILGFCHSAEVEEVRKNDHILTPGRYVGMREKDDEDDASSVEKIDRLTKELFARLDESARLAQLVRQQLERLDV